MIDDFKIYVISTLFIVTDLIFGFYIMTRCYHSFYYSGACEV